jgi:hypothetical protein
VNLAQAISGQRIVDRACVAPRVSPKPRLNQRRTDAVLAALAIAPRSFRELRSISGYRKNNQVSALMAYLRKQGKVAQDGTRCRYRYRLAA